MSTSPLEVKLFLLGPLQIECDRQAVKLPYQKAEALLAFLAMTGSWHSRERLATFLWGNSRDKHARSSLRNALYILRRHLGENAFVTERNYVAINNEVFWIDIKKLQEVIKTPFVDLNKLKNALNFWRGPFLDGLSFYSLPPFDEWLLRERQQSHLFFRDGWMLLSKRLVMKGKKQEALEAALYLINLDPLFEPAHRHLMRLHLMNGDRASVLEQFETLRTYLREELGVEPDFSTIQLQEKALQIESSVSASMITKAAMPLTTLPSKSTFVGRQNELLELSAQWEKILPVGPARMVLVTGEPGIGKTSLVSAWKHRLGNTLYFPARAFETKVNTSYDIWIQVLRATHEKIGLEKVVLEEIWLTELSSLLPEILLDRPDLPRSLYDDSELARGRLMEAIYQWILALAHVQPICLLIDDLQWVDQASLNVLAYILQHGSEISLLILSTQRTVEVGESWNKHEDSLKTMGILHHIPLPRLSFDEVSTMISALGLPLADPISFLQRIYQETEGNPLFVVEMIQTLHKMDLTSADDWPLPSTIQGVIRARLSRLSKNTRQVLELASVMAQDFTPYFFESASDFALEIILNAFDEALEANVIVEQVGETYQFSHDKIRSVIYADLLPERRQYLHKYIAQSLEKELLDGKNIEYETVSYHYESAGDLPVSVEYALRAARRAVELYVDEDALTWYDRALNLLAQVKITLPPEKVRDLSPFQQVQISDTLPLDVLGLVYRQRGLIAQRTGNYTQAEKEFRNALARAKKRSRVDEQGAAHNLLSFLAYLRSEYNLVAEHAQKTFDFGTQANVKQLRAAGLRNLGIAAYNTQDFDRALALYGEALKVYKKANDSVGIATCYNNTGFALRTLRRYEEAIGAFQKAFSYYEAAGQVEGQALILANIGRAYASQGKAETALDYLERAHKLSKEAQTDWITTKIWRTKGRVFSQSKDWDKALGAVYKAQALAEALGSDEDLGASYRLLGEIAAAWEDSNLGSPEQYFKQSIFLLEKVGEQHEMQRSINSFEAYKNKIKT
ncbi:MAG: AAA family ATPase [Anaerolineae bacterium]|nr:AAA family ATPase [Anaerolineae bacterium]MBT7189959.1 AAA family ATPase [Anaerolineae bacterium]